MTDTTRHTPLYQVQLERGGRFVSFAGWQMPVQFAGVMAEHQAVRTRAGLFDVSHMGEMLVEGPDALAALQYAVTNDVSRLVDGKAQYALMCAPSGGVIDDLIIYREAADRYFVCVNASRREVDFSHLRTAVTRFRCKVSDCSDDYAQLALQGPKALGLLASLTDLDLQGLPSFSFVDGCVAGIDKVRVARTGYTGEDGVELYCAPHVAEELWRAIEKAGAAYSLALCGLGARDTLRLEMKYPLYGNDIDLEHNPIEAGLGWVVKLNKGDFVGRAPIAAALANGPERRWVGFKMVGRGIPRHGYPIRVDGRAVGNVTSGTHSPSLGEPIGVGYVPASFAAKGMDIEVVIRERAIAAVVVDTPFYKRETP